MTARPSRADLNLTAAQRERLDEILARPPGESAGPQYRAAARPGSIVRNTEPSERELEVLRRIAAGQTNEQIADSMILGHETIKAHVKSLLTKLCASNRAHAVAIGYQQGFLDLLDSELDA